MSNKKYTIRNARQNEFKAVGQLMVQVYSDLEGFPTRVEQPKYYEMLENVGDFTAKPKTELFVAISEQGQIDGAVIYFGDMQYYGSGGSATNENNAAGFRLLAVNPETRGLGLGKQLTISCINKAQAANLNRVAIHTTKAMSIAWAMYEKLGFQRAEDLDFMQGELPVYGFRLNL